MKKKLKPKLKLKGLPDLPSALILAAVKDLEAVERMKSVTIDMDSWLQRTDDNNRKKGSNAACSVCFGGAVMRRRLAPSVLDQRLIAEDAEIAAHCFDDTTMRKLYALDQFRRGKVLDGLRQMAIEPREGALWFMAIDEIYMSVEEDYGNDPALFKKQMRQIAGCLALAGL